MCKFDFAAGNELELSFSRGDRLQLESRETPNWWRARNAAGATGMIPSNYVEPAEAARVENVGTEAAETTPSRRQSRVRPLSSRRLSLSAGKLDEVALVASVEPGPGSSSMSTSVVPAGATKQATVKSLSEIAAFDADLRKVADDDGQRALENVTALRADVVGGALAARDALALEKWLQALVDTPSLKPLAIAFATGSKVSGDAQVEAEEDADDRASTDDEAAAKVVEERTVRAVALWDFSPSSESELALAANDAVEVSVEGPEDPGEDPDRIVARQAKDGWLLGRCERTGNVGYFPASYVSAAPKPAALKTSRQSRPVSMRSLAAFDALASTGVAVEKFVEGVGHAAVPGDTLTARCTASAWDGGASQATPYASTDWESTKLVVVVGESVATEGLHAGLKGLRRGDTVRLTCAPKLAYGTAGLPPHVPPGSHLIYEIQVLAIERSKRGSSGPPDLLARPAAATDEDHGERLGRVVSLRKRLTLQDVVGDDNARSYPRRASAAGTLPTHPEDDETS